MGFRHDPRAQIFSSPLPQRSIPVQVRLIGSGTSRAAYWFWVPTSAYKALDSRCCFYNRGYAPGRPHYFDLRVMHQHLPTGEAVSAKYNSALATFRYV